MRNDRLAYDSAKEDMQKAMIASTLNCGKSARARAHLSMLDSVKVDYYGALYAPEPGGQCVHDASADLTVQAYEKTMLDPIASAIINANLGLNSMNNGEVPIISIPA